MVESKIPDSRITNEKYLQMASSCPGTCELWHPTSTRARESAQTYCIHVIHDLVPGDVSDVSDPKTRTTRVREGELGKWAKRREKDKGKWERTRKASEQGGQVW